MKNRKQTKILSLFLIIITILSFTGCGISQRPIAPKPHILDVSSNYEESLVPNETEASVLPTEIAEVSTEKSEIFNPSDIPAFSGNPYFVVNDNKPYFTKQEKANTMPFENYSFLDNLKRCQVAYANVCKELMPTEDRESISSVYPSGWKINGKSNNNKYDTKLVDGGRIYNRCHLIGFQLAGENANEKNLITGTRYMNVTGMLPFENMIADYIKETDNHVLLRVTPIYNDNNLVANGVLMEAWSVEDAGEGICFCVYCYNVQPGIEINYATGENHLANTTPISSSTTTNQTTYILNTNSKKFHLPSCTSVSKISSKNKQEYSGKREDLIKQGYTSCGICNS